MVRSSTLRWFQVLKAVALATYKEWTAYRSHVLVSLFVGPVYYLAQVFIWQAISDYGRSWSWTRVSSGSIASSGTWTAAA